SCRVWPARSTNDARPVTRPLGVTDAAAAPGAPLRVPDGAAAPGAPIGVPIGCAFPGPGGIVTSYCPVIVRALMPKALRLLSVPSPATRQAVAGPVSRPLVIARPAADPPTAGRSAARSARVTSY